MGLNYQQVVDKIKELGLNAQARQEILDTRRDSARQLLEYWAEKGMELSTKIEIARKIDPNIRCALPENEPLDSSFIRPPLQESVTLLAADGSQILPDRHRAVQYSLINVGAIIIKSGSGLSPDIFTDTTLLSEDELFTETGMVTEEAIEQRRDIAERRKLLELVQGYPAPLIALTDGPVELWGQKNSGGDDYRKNLEIHQSILSKLQAKNVVVAGYVDKPGADLVIRALEIAQVSSEDEYQAIRKYHPLRGVNDRWLYKFLPVGNRSAVFGLQSRSRLHYTGALALHFFYLNVGMENHPWLVRVEFPRWVADNIEKLDLLHGCLIQQCQIMGARPYPYILHRAHELAVVTLEEKNQVEQLLELEMRRSGLEVEGVSNKQSGKDLPGRGKK